jgi:hypothetical protein
VPCCLLGCFACARGFLILAREQRDSRVDGRFAQIFKCWIQRDIIERYNVIFHCELLYDVGPLGFLFLHFPTVKYPTNIYFAFFSEDRSFGVSLSATEKHRNTTTHVARTTSSSYVARRIVAPTCLATEAQQHPSPNNQRQRSMLIQMYSVQLHRVYEAPTSTTRAVAARQDTTAQIVRGAELSIQSAVTASSSCRCGN